MLRSTRLHRFASNSSILLVVVASALAVCCNRQSKSRDIIPSDVRVCGRHRLFWKAMVQYFNSSGCKRLANESAIKPSKPINANTRILSLSTRVFLDGFSTVYQLLVCFFASGRHHYYFASRSEFENKRTKNVDQFDKL